MAVDRSRHQKVSPERVGEHLGRTEAGVPLTKVDEWSHEELEGNLTHFSMQSRYRPWAMERGSWCGDLATWVYKLWGVNAHLWFGPEAGQNLSLRVFNAPGTHGIAGPGALRSHRLVQD